MGEGEGWEVEWDSWEGEEGWDSLEGCSVGALNMKQMQIQLRDRTTSQGAECSSLIGQYSLHSRWWLWWSFGSNELLYWFVWNDLPAWWWWFRRGCGGW